MNMVDRRIGIRHYMQDTFHLRSNLSVVMVTLVLLLLPISDADELNEENLKGKMIL